MQLSGYTWTCAAGETFDAVADALWGDEKYAAELLAVNPEHAGMLVFSGGEELYVPVVDLPETAGDETMTEPERAPWR